MLKNVYRALVICLLSIILTSLIAVPALAFDARTGSTVTVAAGEVIDGDIYLAGSSIIVDGTINGDVFAAAQTITINGAVNGGVTLAAQTITLNGKVANGARLAGQTISVYSDIGRDLVVVGAEVTLAGTGSVHGDLVVNGGVVQVNGRVDGGILGNNSEVTISGSVGGNIELEVNKLTLTSTADVKGNLKYTSANQAVIQSGAKIGGTTNHIPAPAKQTRQMFPGMLFGLAVAWKIYSFLAMLLIGIIIILIAKRRLTMMANAIASSPWPSLGWGALILIATPIAAIIVMFTIIGIPLSLLALVIYVIAICLSQIPVGLLIGRLIIKQKGQLESRGAMIGGLALGLFILLLLGLIPVIGWIVMLLTIVFGLGSIVAASVKTEFKPAEQSKIIASQ